METVSVLIIWFIKVVISCCTIILLSLISSSLIFKEHLKIKQIVGWISWVLISYASISVVFFIAQVPLINTRGAGPYHLCLGTFYLSITLPFILFINQLRIRTMLVLVVALIINFHLYFSEIITNITALHRNLF